MSAASPAILVAGASRGLGLGLAAIFARHGWQVTATARTPDNAPKLLAAANAYTGLISISQLDITSKESIAALAASVAPASLDVLFIVAGRLDHWHTPIEDVPDETIAAAFITNATSPLAAAAGLLPALKPGGTLVLMTSILGSIGSNSYGSVELYRATKAALNMLAKCFSLRHPDRAIILMHPGWVRTDMGGPGADIELDESVAGMYEVVTTQGGQAGIQYLTYKGETLPW